MTDNGGIAELLRRSRLEAGLTQTEAAEMAGLTQSNLSMIENGKRRVPADTMAALLDIYGVEISLGETGESAGSAGLSELLSLLIQLGESGGKDVAEAVNSRTALTLYLLIRQLYLSDPHNSHRLFSLTKAEIKRLELLLSEQPMLFPQSRVEPLLSSVPAFHSAVARCEALARELLELGKEK